MTRRILIILIAAAALLIVASPALADAPAQGTVVEGVSVPGLSLGDSRSLVETAYGPPASCKNLPYYDGQVGLNGICTFQVEGGGQVTVYYKDADGGPADDLPSDRVFHIRWTQAVSGWTTTAGVNTTLALQDPEAVIAAYPNAVVTYNTVFNIISSIEDRALGILINYSFDYLSGTLFVSMSIVEPSDPPPPQENTMHVDDITLTASKVRGDRRISALVRVEDQWGSSVEGASVSARWVFPDGSSQPVQDATSSTGYAYFELHDAPRGTLQLQIEDVVLDGFIFDSEGSVLSASIRVK